MLVLWPAKLWPRAAQRPSTDPAQPPTHLALRRVGFRAARRSAFGRCPFLSLVARFATEPTCLLVRDSPLLVRAKEEKAASGNTKEEEVPSSRKVRCISFLPLCVYLAALPPLLCFVSICFYCRWIQEAMCSWLHTKNEMQVRRRQLRTWRQQGARRSKWRRSGVIGIAANGGRRGR